MNQSTIETQINNRNFSLKIRVNTNNSIIHTNHDEISRFKLTTKMIYKGAKATIVDIIHQENEFLDPTFKIKNRLGKTKLVKHHDIVLDLLTTPADI